MFVTMWSMDLVMCQIWRQAKNWLFKHVNNDLNIKFFTFFFLTFFGLPFLLPILASLFICRDELNKKSTEHNEQKKRVKLNKNNIYKMIVGWKCSTHNRNIPTVKKEKKIVFNALSFRNSCNGVFCVFFCFALLFHLIPFHIEQMEICYSVRHIHNWFLARIFTHGNSLWLDASKTTTNQNQSKLK